MSSTRKMQRQIAKAAAQRLSDNGKNGKSSKIFKNIWRGQQLAAGKGKVSENHRKQRARESKTDTDIARLIENARQRAAQRAK
jgi:hypothetical protein